MSLPNSDIILKSIDPMQNPLVTSQYKCLFSVQMSLLVSLFVTCCFVAECTSMTCSSTPSTLAPAFGTSVDFLTLELKISGKGEAKWLPLTKR